MPELAVVPKRQCWTLTAHNDSAPAGDPIGDIRVQVLASRFRLAAIKADNWQKKNPEYRIVSLIYSPDTVI